MENKEIWEKVWESGAVPPWDDLSEVIYKVLKLEIPNIRGQKILEVGSGSGRISIKLAEEGAIITLLDLSQKAIDLSKKISENKKINVNFIIASATKLPLKEECFDVVWNAGVLEHFTPKEATEIFSEMYRVTKKDGLCIILAPYKKAVIYNTLRIISQKLGFWKIGREEPFIEDDLNRFPRRPNKLYSTCFLWQFYHPFGWLPFDWILSRVIHRGLKLIFREKFHDVNLKHKGYLLIGIWRKIH